MTTLSNPTLLIVTPFGAAANNGNWRTAERWARLLEGHCRVIVQAGSEGPGVGEADCMIALHARRSNAMSREWRAARGKRPLIIALTGTDPYRDVPAGD